MTMFRKRFEGWLLILFIYIVLATITIDVCEFVYGEGVFFVKGRAMERLGRCDGLLWRRILDESIPGVTLVL